jgi:hypothetical protein
MTLFYKIFNMGCELCGEQSLYSSLSKSFVFGTSTFSICQHKNLHIHLTEVWTEKALYQSPMSYTETTKSRNCHNVVPVSDDVQQTCAMSNN